MKAGGRLLDVLAIGGGAVTAAQLVIWSLRGAWPLYDTACFWLGGRHLLEGAAVYGVDTGLPFRFAPPWAVILAGVSFIPLDVVVAVLLVVEIGAFVWVCGSWRVAGLLAWTPFVTGELATGNIDMLIAASILASVRNDRGAGVLTALMAAAKFSPATTLVLASRRQWKEAIVTGLVLVAITIPVLSLWPQWMAYLAADQPGNIWIPLLPRIPVGLLLLAYRRPWSVAAGAAVLTPAWYQHSFVLLIPAARLAWEKRKRPAPKDRPSLSERIARRVGSATGVASGATTAR